ncbi:DUF2127 domain-containing protein [Microlunatus panaciterrae]|uniref:Membrane protein n=1 Tax=Microlunatus panaciterrae TaxID=400768 RepID=A0ABS2RNG3_9ACTN|nr:putative membrane protein [Microlunatus panaciterrae]
MGIILKGLNGLAETIGGLLLLFVTPDRLHRLVVLMTQAELSEDPHDFVARHILQTADGITGNGLVFGSIYLLAHGIVKIVLVVALLQNRLWAYPWMIGVLIIFIGYQAYRIVLAPGPAMIILTVFDLAIVALTWREYRKQREHRAARTSSDQHRG